MLLFHSLMLFARSEDALKPTNLSDMFWCGIAVRAFLFLTYQRPLKTKHKYIKKASAFLFFISSIPMKTAVQKKSVLNAKWSLMFTYMIINDP